MMQARHAGVLIAVEGPRVDPAHELPCRRGQPRAVSRPILYNAVFDHTEVTYVPLRATRKNKPASLKVAELAAAVPQVVAHRLARMALAGPALSKRDRKEFDLMVAEKNDAFAQAWQAMFTHSLRSNQQLAAAFWSAAVLPPPRSAPLLGKAAAQLHRAALGVLDKGLAPIHRKAVLNARRLARTKLR